MNAPHDGKKAARHPTAVPSNDMKHLFITGVKGSGKSTRLREITQGLPGTPTGFTTVRSDAVFGKTAVHLLKPGEIPTAENFLFFCGECTDPARFDSLGVAALSRPGDYILMDELGPAETDAHAFQQAVLAALDGDVPVYGVLQKADTPFLRQVAAHPKVQIVDMDT